MPITDVCRERGCSDSFGTEQPTGPLLVRLTHHVNILEMNGGTAQAKGFTIWTWPSTRRPSCMSSLHNLVQPAIRALATIIAS